MEIYTKDVPRNLNLLRTARDQSQHHYIRGMGTIRASLSVISLVPYFTTPFHHYMLLCYNQAFDGRKYKMWPTEPAVMTFEPG